MRDSSSLNSRESLNGILMKRNQSNTSLNNYQDMYNIAHNNKV